MRYRRLTRAEAAVMYTLADRQQFDLREYEVHGVMQGLVAQGDVDVIDQQYLITDQGWQSLADHEARPRPNRTIEQQANEVWRVIWTDFRTIRDDITDTREAVSLILALFGAKSMREVVETNGEEGTLKLWDAKKAQLE
jgi:hypothetical protein